MKARQKITDNEKISAECRKVTHYISDEIKWKVQKLKPKN